MPLPCLQFLLSYLLRPPRSQALAAQGRLIQENIAVPWGEGLLSRQKVWRIGSWFPLRLCAALAFEARFQSGLLFICISFLVLVSPWIFCEVNNTSEKKEKETHTYRLLCFVNPWWCSPDEKCPEQRPWQDSVFVILEEHCGLHESVCVQCSLRKFLTELCCLLPERQGHSWLMSNVIIKCWCQFIHFILITWWKDFKYM